MEACGTRARRAAGEVMVANSRVSAFKGGGVYAAPRGPSHRRKKGPREGQTGRQSGPAAILDGTDLVAQARGALVRLGADRALEFLAQHIDALGPGARSARLGDAAGVLDRAVDALEDVDDVRAEDFVVLRAAQAALLAEL